MDYVRLKLWFTYRVFFIAVMASLPVLITSSFYFFFVLIGTAGLIVGLVGYHRFYKMEDYVFHNLAISRLSLYLFCAVFIWIIVVILCAITYAINLMLL